MKAKRHLKIMELVEKSVIETQEDLAEALKKEGFDVTQATVSRDIKELRLIKIPTGDDRYKYGIPRSSINHSDLERMKRMFRDSVLNINFSENIIVIKTFPGTAQAVASAIDHAEEPEIIGTVAGDDTIMVIVKPTQAVPKVFARFTAMQRRG